MMKIGPMIYSLMRIILAGCFLTGCSYLGWGDDDPAALKNEDKKAKVLGIGLPHPRSPEAWETDVLLVSNELPDSQELQDCHKESKQLSKDSINDIGILQAQTAMSEMVNQRPEVYHWCFYYISRHLDRELDTVGMLWSEKNDIFLTIMRELWVMARSLEEHTKDPRYYRYLHHRYLTLSRDVFGRHLEVVGPPIDHPPVPPGKFNDEDGENGEEAGEVDVDE